MGSGELTLRFKESTRMTNTRDRKFPQVTLNSGSVIFSLEENMKPTIGRIVHFVQEKPPQYQPPDGQKLVCHLPAIITAVWTDNCVNLQVFTDGSNSEIDGTNFRSVKWI